MGKLLSSPIMNRSKLETNIMKIELMKIGQITRNRQFCLNLLRKHTKKTCFSNLNIKTSLTKRNSEKISSHFSEIKA